jgi:hypothetical protein
MPDSLLRIEAWAVVELFTKETFARIEPSVTCDLR